QVEPGEIALVVIVGKQRVRAQTEEIRKRGIARERRGLAQGGGCTGKEWLVLFAIWHADQPVAAPLDHGIGAVDRSFVFGMLLDVLLDLGALHIVREPLAAGRHGLFADKRAVL